ncbi:MAG: dehydrogenase [Planctomycetaceae bacterium]|nr:dehydrogenase [Planctomycetaceae bacterium]
MTDALKIAIVGYKFMGKAHSNAYHKAGRFFELPIELVLQTACGRHRDGLAEFANRWGWRETATSWREVVARDDIDIVDISSPTDTHREIAIAAAEAGKHILCEKPMSLSAADALSMCAAVKRAGVTHAIGHNYRRVPAIRLAKQMIEDGKLGELYHWRGTYLQDWIVDPNFPLTWHLQQERAGYGPHGDLNSHSVDLARYLVGEIKSVQCTLTQFIDQRPLPDEEREAAFAAAVGQGTGHVTVDDASFMVVEFDNGALGSFEASRFATGRKNYNYFEIYGSKGSLCFNLERLNELQFFSREDPPTAQGFKTILVTESSHPYIANWWPPGHSIGYEHTFIHQVVDFVRCIQGATEMEPNFFDGLRTMEVLDAAALSSREGRRVDVPRAEV